MARLFSFTAALQMTTHLNLNPFASELRRMSGVRVDRGRAELLNKPSALVWRLQIKVTLRPSSVRWVCGWMFVDVSCLFTGFHRVLPRLDLWKTKLFLYILCFLGHWKFELLENLCDDIKKIAVFQRLRLDRQKLSLLETDADIKVYQCF